MKNTQKVGILIGILVIPALIFLFLKFFGQNYYNLPYLYPQVDDYGNAVVKNGDTVFHQIPRFELIDKDGKAFSSDKTKDKIYVADFFFTRCGTICPKLSKSLVRVQEAYQNNSDVLIVSHTVDPEHDKGEVLQKYAADYKAIDNKWFFVTGDKANLYKLIIEGYKLPVSDASMLNKPEDAFVHSEKLLLIDKKGFVRGIYDGTNKADVDRLITEIDILLGSFMKKK